MFLYNPFKTFTTWNSSSFVGKYGTNIFAQSKLESQYVIHVHSLHIKDIIYCDK